MAKFNLLDRLKKFMEREEKEWVALDLGASLIKGIYVEKNQIKNFFIEKNTSEPVQRVSDLLRKQGLLSKPVKLAIKGEDTLIRYVPFPKVDKKNLKQAFSYEISKFIPFSREDIYFDISVLDENYNSEELLLFLALAKKKLIDSLIKNFREAEINLGEITLNSAALIDLFLSSHPQNLNIAIVDIGLNSTLLNLINKGMPCLSREVKISTSNLLVKLSQKNNLALKETEDFLIKSEDSPQTKELVKEVILELCDEIKSSLDYFELNWGERVERVLITGGLSNIKGVEEAMGSFLGIEAKTWNTFDNIGLNFNQEILNFQNLLGVTLGLNV